MLRFLVQFFAHELGPVELVVYILSITYVCLCATPLHEFAHAFVAVKLGDDTPKLRGRLTINPMAHIDPIGILMIFLFGFGYAKPVETRIRNFKKPKRDMALVALAGPMSNFIQAFIYLLIASVCARFVPNMSALLYIYIFFDFAATINIFLAVFNMLPIPPLDGSKVLAAFLPAKIYFKLMQYERFISIGLMILLFTRVLTVPLEYISYGIKYVFEIVINIPLSFIIG